MLKFGGHRARPWWQLQQSHPSVTPLQKVPSKHSSTLSSVVGPSSQGQALMFDMFEMFEMFEMYGSSASMSDVFHVGREGAG
mgnify:CR=1 FL=1